MAEPFYRVGEKRGPFIVTESTFEFLPGGRTREWVKDSGGNSSTTFGWDENREYHQVCKRDGNLLVPYTVRHSLTEEGVPDSASWVYVGNDKSDYWRVLCEWWKPKEFTIIEHDVKASPEIFEEFAICNQPWCTFKYSNHTTENHEAWKYGILGCTRFSARVMKKCPKALIDLDWRFRDWHYVSTGLGIAIREAGFEPHLHGVVDHHRMMDVGGVVKAMAA